MNPFSSMPEADTKEFAAYFQEQDQFSHKIGYKILSVTQEKANTKSRSTTLFSIRLRSFTEVHFFPQWTVRLEPRWPLGFDLPI